jgi:Holliday junction resolvasome RuvABC endonuclease subunit
MREEFDDLVLALDISSTSTGWALFNYTTDTLFEFGVIQPKSKDMVERLKIYKDELLVLLDKHKPKYVCHEELNYARNIKTVKALFCFIGVTSLIAYEYNKIKSEAFETTMIRKCMMGPGYGGVKKIEIQVFVCKFFNLVPLEKLEPYEKEIALCKLQKKQAPKIFKKKMENLSKEFSKELMCEDICDAIALAYTFAHRT